MLIIYSKCDYSEAVVSALRQISIRRSCDVYNPSLDHDDKELAHIDTGVALQSTLGLIRGFLLFRNLSLPCFPSSPMQLMPLATL